MFGTGDDEFIFIKKVTASVILLKAAEGPLYTIGSDASDSLGTIRRPARISSNESTCEVILDGTAQWPNGSTNAMHVCS